MPQTGPHHLRSILAGSIGNLVEWFDWYCYSAFSLYFAKSFFPSGDQTAQLLNAAAVFAVGFLMRPLGGWVMGRYADRHGRRQALTVSVLLMCGGSLVIACTPSYATIGLGAPALLIIARMMQGLSVGGEYGASATYLSEVARGSQRGFWSSFQYVTLILGQLLALGVLIVLQRTLTVPQLESWGWRISFALGAACAVVAVRLRRSMVETDAYTRAAVTDATAKPVSSLASLRAHPRAVLTVFGLTAGGALAFYTFTTYAQKFLVNTAGFAKDEATLISAAALAIFMCVQPLYGALSDRIGRRPLLIAFGVLGTLGTAPLLTALAASRTVAQALALLTLALLVISGYTSINAVVKAELFPTRVRALGVAFPYAIAVSVFGGTAEYLALWFKKIGHEPWFYGYVSVCIACSLLVYITMPETRHSTVMRE
jgi:MFS transporter, MHS family, alpha-ketoglutarate permease